MSDFQHRRTMDGLYAVPVRRYGAQPYLFLKEVFNEEI